MGSIVDRIGVLAAGGQGRGIGARLADRRRRRRALRAAPAAAGAGQSGGSWRGSCQAWRRLAFQRETEGEPCEPAAESGFRRSAPPRSAACSPRRPAARGAGPRRRVAAGRANPPSAPAPAGRPGPAAAGRPRGHSCCAGRPCHRPRRPSSTRRDQPARGRHRSRRGAGNGRSGRRPSAVPGRRRARHTRRAPGRGGAPTAGASGGSATR